MSENERQVTLEGLDSERRSMRKSTHIPQVTTKSLEFTKSELNDDNL